MAVVLGGFTAFVDLPLTEEHECRIDRNSVQAGLTVSLWCEARLYGIRGLLL